MGRSGKPLGIADSLHTAQHKAASMEWWQWLAPSDISCWHLTAQGAPPWGALEVLAPSTAAALPKLQSCRAVWPGSPKWGQQGYSSIPWGLLHSYSNRDLQLSLQTASRRWPFGAEQRS